MDNALSAAAKWIATLLVYLGPFVACAGAVYGITGSPAAMTFVGVPAGFGVCWLLATRGVFERIG